MKGYDSNSLQSVAVFPLPDYVLYPNTLIPFHLFEPRYRRMAADCLAGSRMIVVAGLCPGWEDHYYGTPDVFEVAGLGKIASDERLPDGRFNIIVHGLARVRIVEWIRDEPYRMARVDDLPDLDAEYDPKSPPVAVAERIRTLRTLGMELALRIGPSGGPLSRVLGTTPELGPLTHRLASMLVADPALRQSLLEERVAIDRADRLVDVLGRTLLDATGGESAEGDASLAN